MSSDSRTAADSVVLLLMACLVAACLSWPLAASPGQDPKAVQKVTDDLIAKGAENLDVQASYDAYIKAGLSINEANAKVDELRELYKRWQQAHEKNDPNVQHGDFDFGQVYPGDVIPATLTLTNGCKVDQPATLTYPRMFKLTGPKSVIVPKFGSLDVQMELDMSKPSAPTPPFPRPIEFMCHPMDDILKVVHQQVQLPPEKVPGGTEIYTCLGAVVEYSVTLHVHLHPPLPPAPKEEFSGGKKKPPKPACKNYWDHGDFFPTIEYADPTRCRDDIRDLATPWFGDLVEEEKVPDRSNYEWLPKKADIARLTEKELLELKHRAVQQLRGGK